MAALHSFYSLLINDMPWHLGFTIESMKASKPCIHLCPIFHIVRDILQPSALKPIQAGVIQCLEWDQYIDPTKIHGKLGKPMVSNSGTCPK